MNETRAALIDQLTSAICTVPPGHPTRVAVDGITAAGKSTLTAELGESVGRRGRPVITLSMDDFHQPRSHRYRQGRRSAVGYFEDAYDFDAFLEHVLVPLGPGGNRQYRRRVHDLATDQVIDEEPVEAPADALVIVDGSFLQRSELRSHWDYRILVRTSFDVARDRVVGRDADFLGGAEAARELFDVRYQAAFRLYLESARPEGSAEVVVDNDDPARPTLHWASNTGGSAN